MHQVRPRDFARIDRDFHPERHSAEEVDRRHRKTFATAQVRCALRGYELTHEPQDALPYVVKRFGLTRRHRSLGAVFAWLEIPS